MTRNININLNSKFLKFNGLYLSLDKTFRINIDNNIIFPANATLGDDNNNKFIKVTSIGDWVAYCEGGGGIVGGGSGGWISIRESKESLSTDTVIGGDGDGFWVFVTFNGSTATRSKTITITETTTNNVIELFVTQQGQLGGDLNF